MTDPNIIDIYSQPQQGGELQYFVGKQYGSGWLKTLGRLAFPILKRIGRFLGKAAKDILVNKRPVLESLKRNAMDEVEEFAPGSFSEPPKKKSKKDINNDVFYDASDTIFEQR